MRYLIKYTKKSDIKYVAHLELMRTIQRIIRRSELPVKYSQGFNPHMSLSIAQPLAVGVYSRGEYMDVDFNEELDEEFIKEKLNLSSTDTIKFLDVKKIKEEDKKVPQSMAAVEAARYILKLKCMDIKDIQKDIHLLINMEEWKIIKKGKKGEKEVNIRPLIKNFKFNLQENLLVIDTTVACGSKSNLSAQLLGEYIKNNIDGINKDAFISIERQDMFAYKEQKLVPLNEYLG